MTCMYKNYDVKITTFDVPYWNTVTPLVEIAANGSQRAIATTERFPTAEQAEQHGFEMARRWIEEHVQNDKTTDRSFKKRP